jgi:hypothetical protein
MLELDLDSLEIAGYLAMEEEENNYFSSQESKTFSSSTSEDEEVIEIKSKPNVIKSVQIDESDKKEIYNEATSTINFDTLRINDNTKNQSDKPKPKIIELN